MSAFRRTRVLGLLLAGLLALLGVAFGSALPASAAAGDIQGTVSSPIAVLPGISVIVYDSLGVASTTTTDALGNYTVTPTNGDDTYAIAVGSDDYVWQDVSVAFDATTGPIDFTLQPGVTISGTVIDVATTLPPLVTPVYVVAVDSAASAPVSSFPTAPPVPGGYFFDYHGPSPAGTYKITVPLDDQYMLIAFDPAFYYDPQLFDGVNLSTGGGCLCGTIITVPSTTPPTPVTGTDFALYAYTDWVYFSVFAERQPTPDPYPGVTVTLERKNLVGGWDVAAVDVTGADGLADLFGLGAGDYRIRYSAAGVTLAVVSAQDPGGTPFLIESGGTVVEFGNYDPALGGCACGGGPGSFDGEDVDLLFAAATGGGGGSGTPATRPKPRTSVFSGFTLPTPSATPTPTPTPTSSPTPSSSPTHEPTASPSPTPGPEPAAADMWWLFWLLLVLLILGIIVTIIVIVRRR